MQKLKNEIAEKKLQMRVLEQRMAGSFEESSDSIEMSQVIFFLSFFSPFVVYTLHSQREDKVSKISALANHITTYWAIPSHGRKTPCCRLASE